MSLGGIAEHKAHGLGVEIFHMSTAAVVDVTAQTSAAFDQAPDKSPQQTEHITCVVGFKPTTWTGADTAVISLSIEHSADNGVADAWAAAPTAVQPKAAVTRAVADNAINVIKPLRYDLKISSLKRYVRFVASVDLTGTAAGQLVLVGQAGGGLKQPQFVPVYGTSGALVNSFEQN